MALLAACASTPPANLELTGGLAGNDVCDASAGEPFVFGLGFLRTKDRPVTLDDASFTTDGNVVSSVFLSTSGGIGGGPESDFPIFPHVAIAHTKITSSDAHEPELILRINLIKNGRTVLTDGVLRYHDTAGSHRVKLASHISLNTSHNCG